MKLVPFFANHAKTIKPKTQTMKMCFELNKGKYIF